MHLTLITFLMRRKHIINQNVTAGLFHGWKTFSKAPVFPWPALWLFSDACRWKLNDSFVQPRPGSRFSLNGGNLHISRLNKDEDVGIYQCLASNSFGTIVSREASLHIACKYSAAVFLSKNLLNLFKEKFYYVQNIGILTPGCTLMLVYANLLPFLHNHRPVLSVLAKHSLIFGLLPPINDHLPPIDLFLVITLPVAGHVPHNSSIRAHRYVFFFLHVAACFS